MSQDPVQTVMKIFELTMKRDAEGMRAMVTPDFFFSSTYPAHMGFEEQATGPDEGVGLLLRISEQFDVLGAGLKDVIAQGDAVVILVEEKLRAKATGKITTTSSVAFLKVRDDKVCSARIFPDTFAVSASLRPDEAPPSLAAPTRKSASSSKKNTLKAAGKSGAGKNTARAAKPGKGAARGKKKTARARA